MSECYPCESCWCSVGNCSGVSLLVGCCGCWVCKGFVMEQLNPNCCFCFEQSGIGCTLFCCGCNCCHPIWMNLYVQQRFPQPCPYPHAPYAQNPFPAPNPYNTPYSNNQAGPTPYPY